MGSRRSSRFATCVPTWPCSISTCPGATASAWSTALAGTAPGLGGLTKTELVILKMIADDKTSKEIAAALFISVRTVDRHRSNLCAKLNLHGANALTKFAISRRADL